MKNPNNTWKFFWNLCHTHADTSMQKQKQQKQVGSEYLKYKQSNQN